MFGNQPTLSPMTPSQMLQEEYRKRQEALTRDREIQSANVAHRQFEAEERMAQQELEQKMIDQALKREMFEEEIKRAKVERDKEVSRRYYGAPTALATEGIPLPSYYRTRTKEPTQPLTEAPEGMEATSYDVYGRPKGFKKIKEVKPPKPPEPTWKEKEFITDFNKTYDIGENLTRKEAKYARPSVDEYNEYARKYKFDEVEIDESGWGQRLVIKKEPTAPIPTPTEEVAKSKIIGRMKSRFPEDKYGLGIGETVMLDDNTIWIYKGNNLWYLKKDKKIVRTTEQIYEGETAPQKDTLGIR